MTNHTEQSQQQNLVKEYFDSKINWEFVDFIKRTTKKYSDNGYSVMLFVSLYRVSPVIEEDGVIYDVHGTLSKSLAKFANSDKPVIPSQASMIPLYLYGKNVSKTNDKEGYVNGIDDGKTSVIYENNTHLSLNREIKLGYEINISSLRKGDTRKLEDEVNEEMKQLITEYISKNKSLSFTDLGMPMSINVVDNDVKFEPYVLSDDDNHQNKMMRSPRLKNIRGSYKKENKAIVEYLQSIINWDVFDTVSNMLHNISEKGYLTSITVYYKHKNEIHSCYEYSIANDVEKTNDWVIDESTIQLVKDILSKKHDTTGDVLSYSVVCQTIDDKGVVSIDKSCSDNLRVVIGKLKAILPDDLHFGRNVDKGDIDGRFSIYQLL